MWQKWKNTKVVLVSKHELMMLQGEGAAAVQRLNDVLGKLCKNGVSCKFKDTRPGIAYKSIAIFLVRP